MSVQPETKRGELGQIVVPEYVTPFTPPEPVPGAFKRACGELDKPERLWGGDLK